MSTTVDFTDLFALFDAKSLSDLDAQEPDIAECLRRKVAAGARPDDIARVVAAYTGSSTWGDWLHRAAKALAAQRQGGAS